ncbi:ComF family protein [Flavobacteriaceae bacterium R38]|nr:ComF family protein [Flavobacteriaceae bacterium R38]
MLNDIESLFFPNLCLGCNSLLLRNEKSICTNCRHELPLTNYHRIKENPVKKIFYGRVPVENATAFFHFEKKSIVQQLIHHLKYKGQEQIGAYIGQWMADELKECNDYQNIDIVIPVPLHIKKLHKRGYNQVSLFAKNIAEGIHATYNDTILVKSSNTQTQTFKNRVTRWQNDNSVFVLHNTSNVNLNNKHILLVDDVITTGATLEACAKVFQSIENVKISVVTMAVTY